MVRTRDQIKWPMQKGPKRHCTREKKKGKTKEKRGRQHQRVAGLDFNSSQRAAEDRHRRRKIVADVSSGAPTTLIVPGHSNSNSHASYCQMATRGRKLFPTFKRPVRWPLSGGLEHVGRSCFYHVAW